MDNNEQTSKQIKSETASRPWCNGPFSGKGNINAERANAIYWALTKRNEEGKTSPITIRDVLCFYMGKDVPKNSHPETTTEWQAFKLLFPKVCEIIRAIEGRNDVILESGKTKGKTWQYVGSTLDPLGQKYRIPLRHTVQDLIEYIKLSANLLPDGWVTSHFYDEDSQFSAKDSCVSFGRGRLLRNTDKLTILVDAIDRNAILRFHYQPFDMQGFDLLFRPEYLKEYNGRCFLLGRVLEGSPYQEEIYPFNIAIDRIDGDIAVKGYERGVKKEVIAERYNHFFQHIIGVSRLKEEIGHVQQIVIRTYSAYIHGLIQTKKFHHSQMELSPFDIKQGYGEFSFSVEYNRELLGMLLSFGQSIEVMSPLSIRQKVIEALRQQLARYEQSAIGKPSDY